MIERREYVVNDSLDEPITIYQEKTMKKPTYAGKIENKGSQVVEALFPAGRGKSGKVTKGEDLRAKKGGKK